METSNSPDGLKERLKSWRAQLTGIGLTKEDRDELQSHVEDVLEELRVRGFSEDEAWILATHRIGEPRDIRQEYKKVYEARIPVLNHVVFWLITSFLGLQIIIITRQLLTFLIQIGRIPWLSMFCFIILFGIVAWLVYKRRTIVPNKPWTIFLRWGALMIMAWTFGMVSLFDAPNCYNSNKVFENHSPKSDIYKAELIRKFSRTGTDNLYYRFGYTYSESNRDYIVVSAIGKGFCGYFSIDVTNSKSMARIVRNKGLGYRGSLWKGLKFDLISDGTRNKFVFRSVEVIVD